MEPEEDSFAGKKISRRKMLGLIGAGITAITIGCGGGGSNTASSNPSGTNTGTTTSGSTTGSTTSTTTGSSGGACTVTPEGEVGPYFTDDSASGFDRSNILANIDGTDTQPGIPLTLSLTVYDTENNCAALDGAQIDIWHCNASGVYSDESSENTSSQTWLRGYQITDSSGSAKFTTIIPGWYQGRTTHIHLRIRSKYDEASSPSDGTNTTQLFFSQSLIDEINTSVAPYSTHGSNPTTNAGDRVYSSQTDGQTLLALSGDNTSGYTTSFAIYLPITSE